MNQIIPDHVMQFGSRRRTPRRRLGSLIRTNRFTIAGSLFAGIIIPLLLQPLIGRGLLPRETVIASYWVSIAASIFGLGNAHVILRKVGMLPLVDDKMLIFPAFLTSYALSFILFTAAFGRFGLYPFVMSFAFGSAWYFAMAYIRIRLYHPRLAYVGPMPDDDDLLLANIEWEPLARARLPHDVVGIVFDSRRPLSASFERLFSRAYLRNLPIYEAGRFREMLTGRVKLEAHPVEIFGQLLPSLPYLRVKRVIDMVFVIPGIVLALPVMVIAAIAIRLESPGPVIFRQSRTGFQGRRFTCYKLRTMRTDIAGPLFTTADDPRITRLGKFLRKTRIDELPQLFNILKGEMSWIGPRPEATGLARSYQRAIPYYSCRHAVHPGVTGWAAIHQGNVAQVDAARRKLEYDFYYVKYFSIWLDLLIVLMTIRTVITGHGSK